MTSLRHAWPCLLGVLLFSASAARAQDAPPPTPATPDSEQVEILLFEGQLALEEDRIPEAINTLSDVVKMAPDLVEGHLWYAEALVRALRADQVENKKEAALLALDEYRWVLSKNPDNEQAQSGADFLMATFLQDEMAPFKTDAGRTHWQSGREAQDRKQWKKAAEEFRAAIKAEPGVAAAHRALGESLLADRKSKDAVKALQKAVALAPDDMKASFLLGQALEASGDKKKALELYDTMMGGSGRADEAALRVIAILGTKPPGKRNAAELGLLGRAHLEIGDSLAAPTLQAAVAKDPSHKNKRDLGIAEFLNGQDQAAVAQLESVVTEDSSDVEALYYLAAAHLRRDETQAGRDILRKAMAHDPKDANVQKLLGLSLAEDPAQSEEALSMLNKAHAGGARIENFGCILGSLYMRVGDPHRALLAFQNCVSDNPDEANAYYGLGVLYDDRGDTRRAVDYFEKYISLDPSPDRAALFRLGVAYLRSGQDTKGYSTLRRIVKPDSTAASQPDSTKISDLEILEATSYFLASARRFEDAIFIGEMLLTKAPENAIYNNNLAMSYADANKEPGRAHMLAVKANHLSPNNPGYMDTLGWALARLKRYKEAEKTLTQSLDKAKKEGLKNLSEIYYHLGVVYKDTDRPDKAKQYLTLALENPPSPYLQNEIERLLDEGTPVPGTTK
jgi:tetratricopeptide (TPR) repeat protein